MTKAQARRVVEMARRKGYEASLQDYNDSKEYGIQINARLPDDANARRAWDGRHVGGAMSTASWEFAYEFVMGLGRADLSLHAQRSKDD